MYRGAVRGGKNRSYSSSPPCPGLSRQLRPTFCIPLIFGGSFPVKADSIPWSNLSCTCRSRIIHVMRHPMDAGVDKKCVPVLPMIHTFESSYMVFAPYAPLRPALSGLSCYAQPFGYNGISWAWDLKDIAAQINMTHRLAEHWDTTHPGRCVQGRGRGKEGGPLAQIDKHRDECSTRWGHFPGTIIVVQTIPPHTFQGPYCVLRGAHQFP